MTRAGLPGVTTADSVTVMTEPTVYETPDTGMIEDLLVGRRIIQAEKGDDFDYPNRQAWDNKPEGRLVLDDGTVLYLAGNKGGCSCSSGDYDLRNVATVDNIITRARVEALPDEWNLDREEGIYRIYVIADATEINVAEFVGTDGNGYYGTGFELAVIRPPAT